MKIRHHGNRHCVTYSLCVRVVWLCEDIESPSFELRKGDLFFWYSSLHQIRWVLSNGERLYDFMNRGIFRKGNVLLS